MRKKIVAGNWKMNLHNKEAMSLIQELNKTKVDSVQLVIFPPSIYIQGAIQNKKTVHVGAQNIYPKDEGAFTGEIAASQLKDMGVEFCLVGHSERRSLFNESHEFLKEKVDSLIKNGMQVVFCCGEVKSEREAGIQLQIVEKQLNESLFHLSPNTFENVIIAYEPVWAIGTGLTASAEQADEMHKSIRNLIAQKYSAETAENTSILYGGSCNPENAKSIFSKENVDGGLIGGASLKADSFLAIANSF